MAVPKSDIGVIYDRSIYGSEICASFIIILSIMIFGTTWTKLGRRIFEQGDIVFIYLYFKSKRLIGRSIALNHIKIKLFQEIRRKTTQFTQI